MKDIFTGKFGRKGYWLVAFFYHIYAVTILKMYRSCSEWAITIVPEGCSDFYLNNEIVLLLLLTFSTIVFLIISLRRLNDMGAKTLTKVVSIIVLNFYPFSLIVTLWLTFAKPKVVRRRVGKL